MAISLLLGFRDVMFWIRFETPVNLSMLLLKYLPKQKENAQLNFMIFLGLLVQGSEAILPKVVSSIYRDTQVLLISLNIVNRQV